MANMIMASSTTAATTKSLMAPPPPPSSPPSSSPSIPTLKFPKIQLPKPLQFSSIVAATLAMAPPSLAEEFEKAQLFDFDATLPIIAAEFLILMVALDKLYYSPLGNFMDQRDKSIREKLGSVKDTSAEVKQLEEQAAAVMKAARVEISAALNKMKKETQAEVEVKVAEGRKKVEAELAEALASLEKQKEETMKALDAQIDKLSDDIVKKVLPVS